MGQPIYEPPAKEQVSTPPPECRPSSLERNPFRRTQNPYFDVDWDILSESPWGGGWTQRRVRQRADISHTPQTQEAGASARPSVEQAQATNSDQHGADSDSDTESESPTAAVQQQQRQRTAGQYNYSVRLGYDPRVFLIDSSFRGQQELTPEAEAWAEQFRLTTPLAGGQQVARRTQPRRDGVFHPRHPRHAAEASQTRLTTESTEVFAHRASCGTGVTASDSNDPLSRSFAALHNLLRESPLSTTRPQRRERLAERPVTASGTPEHSMGVRRHVQSQDASRLHLTPREVTDRLSERLQELRRFIENSPLDTPPEFRESQRRRLQNIGPAIL